MISLMDCLNAIYPDGVRHKCVWCSKGHKLGNVRKKDVDSKLLVRRCCQECPDFEPFDIRHERDE